MGTKKAPMQGSGKKGGTIFPRFDLEDAVVAAKRLVSKAHTSAVPKDIYFSGVLQLSGPRAEMKSSALKQFGFLMGSTKDGFSASPIAKQVANLDEGPERASALRQAALTPKVFKGIFDAFHGDTVTKGRLKQRAAELNVHPDMLETCIKIYIDSLSLAELVSVEGDQVAHVPQPTLSNASLADSPAEPEGSANDEEQKTGDVATGDAAELKAQSVTDAAKGKQSRMSSSTARGLVNVSINLDSSLDTDKLERQLELLKRFGVI
jgi:hypothetical protein